MTAQKGTRSSWVRFLTILLLLWMLLVPMAAMAGGEDDPGTGGGMGSIEGTALPPSEDEQPVDWTWTKWLAWLLTLQILP
jgi:hypothetical protein